MAKDDPTLKSQYAKQVAADLKGNVGEQERIRSEVLDLQNRLEALRKDHDMLEGVLAALGDEAARGQAPAKASAVPRPRRAKGDPSAGESRTPKGRTSAKAAGATEAGRKASSATPSLREIVVALLGRHHEPRSAAEVTKELEQVHPERAANVTLVRNALEASVVKNRATRTKQQNSVYYSVTKESAGSVAPDAPTLVAADSEPAT